MLRHLVQLHLSRECNKVRLAAAAARQALDAVKSDAAITTAAQDRVSNVIELDGGFSRKKPIAARSGT